MAILFMGLYKTVKNMFNSLSGVDEETWNVLDDTGQVEKVIDLSKERPQLVYKHSNRCSVCMFAKSELEGSSEQLSEYADMHYVNVIGSREISDDLAERLGVRHESPQVLLLHNGKVVYHVSHGAIKSDKLLQKLRPAS